MEYILRSMVINKIGIAFVALYLCTTPSLAAEAVENAKSSLEQSGLSLATEKCSRCHAVTKTDTSTHAEAPPFRDVFTRYPPEHLAEALAEGIVSGHPDMPEFTFQPDEIDALIAHLNSLVKAKGQNQE